ncbi:MAG: MFS transporter [Hyphomonadaceae bacterium]
MSTNAAAPERAEDESYPSPVIGWITALILFVLVVLSVLDRNILTLLVEPIKRDLGITDVEFSLLYGLAFSISYGIAAMPAGWMIDKFSRRLVIWGGVVIWSISTALTGAARSFEMLFLARTGVGAGEAVLSPGQQSMLADLFPPSRLTLPLSVSALGLKVGGGAALIIGGALSALFPPGDSFSVPVLGAIHGWQLIFLLIGLPGLLIGLLIFLAPEPKRRSAGRVAVHQATFVEYFRLIGQNLRFYIGHHLGQALYVAVAIGIAAWAPAFFTRIHGWSEAHTGIWLGSAMLWGSVFGLPLHGLIADKLFQRGVLDIHMRYSMIAALVGIPLGAGAFFVANPYVACLLIGAFFFVISVYASLPTVSVQSVLPSDMRGKAASIMLIVIGTGGTILGPLIVASITELVFGHPDDVGKALALTTVIGLLLVAGLFAMTLQPVRARMAAALAPAAS